MKDNSIDEAKFFEALKEVKERNDDAQAGFYVQLLIALSEYDNFIGMMQSYKLAHP